MSSTINVKWSPSCLQVRRRVIRILNYTRKTGQAVYRKKEEKNANVEGRLNEKVLAGDTGIIPLQTELQLDTNRGRCSCVYVVRAAKKLKE